MLKDEQETILLTDEGSDKWDIMTFNAKMQHRLDDFAAKHPELCQKIAVHPNADRQSNYLISKGCVSISFRSPMSESERERRAKIMKETLARVKDK